MIYPYHGHFVNYHSALGNLIIFFLHGFWQFSRREAAQLLPRLFEPVPRLLWPFFVSGLVAGGCPGAELGPLFPKKLTQ